MTGSPRRLDTDRPTGTDAHGIVLYTAPHDPYGVRARTLLQRKGLPFVERSLPAALEEMHQATGKTEGPQIVIHGTPIGSFDALGSLDLRGELDALARVPRSHPRA